MANQEQLELLKQGVEAWNQWRRENPDIQVDLSGAKLVNVNLCNINLSFTNLQDANLQSAFFNYANLQSANLHKADLRGASLGYAILTGVDLSNAFLMAANLYGASLDHSNLYQVDLGSANLIQAKLCGSNLLGAKLVHADLSRADFSNTNLTNATLREAQVLSTDFCGATLTGVCIENWNINVETNLIGSVCEYVYLKELLAQKEKMFVYLERRPSSGNFKPGEFIALFQKALSTVDLIFADSIDWQAFFQSFQELRSQYDNLSIQAIEKKSGGAFVIRLEVPAEVNKAAIERSAKQLYEMKLQLLEAQYQQQLQLKDIEIEGYRRENTNLLGIVTLLGGRPINSIAVAGSQSMGDRNIHMGSGNYNERIEGNYIQGNYINMSQDLTQAAQQIQDLLQQLQDQGVPVEDSQQQVATDIAKQAEANPAMMGKLVLWGKAMANKASETTVSEAAKIVFTLALKAAGLA